MTMFEAGKLDAALKAAGLTIVGVGVCKAEHPTSSPATFFPDKRIDRVIRVDWTAKPAKAEIDKAKKIIETFDWNAPDASIAQRDALIKKMAQKMGMTEDEVRMVLKI